MAGLAPFSGKREIMETAGLRVHITGIVQGVGFRPFVHALATRLALKGWVRNTSAGVDIEVDGPVGALDKFLLALHTEIPPLAHIDEIQIEHIPPNGFDQFSIIQSESIPDAFQPISPDVCICPDCLRELFDARDRRYRYPFINCTNCGPRFTIIQDIPYDRPYTTMAGFPMCTDCAREYEDPGDRRFHAQPVACPVCGPQVWLEYSPTMTSAQPHLPELISGDEAIRKAQALLAEGRIVAIKGLGGFHLACDAQNEAAVVELRRRKLRVDKPFAIMMPDIPTVRSHCMLDDLEQALLESTPRPVVLLQRLDKSDIAAQVAPFQGTLGVMLPYTPLHYLLFAAGAKINKNRAPDQANTPQVLVMTSGNLSEEPIAFENDDARERLASLADAFLLHNRPIHTRCDDSVVRVFNPQDRSRTSAPENIRQTGSRAHPEAVLPIRRSRGYAPFPLKLHIDAPPLLAAGAELKNTFCLARDRYAIVSHHIGDMENYETLTSFEEGIAHFERLFRIEPVLLAYDLHPNYMASRYALERAEHAHIPAIGVQHHHAHIAACMLENKIDQNAEVIGVAFDGTGYGMDGAIWGGEFLLAGYKSFSRIAHLDYIPLPGGDAATRKPARTALAYLWKAGIDWEIGLAPVDFLCAEERQALRSQLELGINAPLTSSVGRLFDAAASIAGVRQQVNYEAQAAIEFEQMTDPFEMGRYPYEIINSRAGNAQQRTTEPIIINPAPLIAALVDDVQNRTPGSILAARFHNTAAQMVADVCQRLRQLSGINQVALSGGVWQNITLLSKTYRLLEQDGFEVFYHTLVPPNDGGISLGQAAVAASIISS
jgi:hydrogenase maturation protein HypF